MQQSSFTTSAPSRSAADAPLLDRLRGLIVSGVVPPGDLLGETALAEEFEVSRTPIREALKQLEREGLVEIRPRVGTFVRKPSQREIYELFQLKESLEGLAAGLLAQRGDVPELRSLIRNVESEHDVVRAGDRAAYSTLVHDFHHTLIAGADNQKLSEQRANAVRTFLLEHGIAAERVVAKGYGESKPVAGNDTDEGRAKNRRTEVTVL